MGNRLPLINVVSLAGKKALFHAFGDLRKAIADYTSEPIDLVHLVRADRLVPEHPRADQRGEHDGNRKQAPTV